MANEPSTAAEQSGGKSFFKELSSAAAKKALAPLLAAAATAGTSYLTRKSTEIWQEDVLPKVREKGGGKAIAKEALEKVAGRLSGRYAQVVSGFAERLGDGSGGDEDRQKEARADDQPRAEQGSTEPEQASSEQAGTSEPDEQREQERKQRQKRRQQRQRALQKSAST
jgi:hypothetical protein